MKRLVYTLLILSFLVSSVSCSDAGRLTIGFTPTGLPITLSVDGNGHPNVTFNGVVSTPLGSFSIGYTVSDIPAPVHYTYIEIVNRHVGNKHIIRLTDVGEKVLWDSDKCHVSVENLRYCTVVTVESDEISNLLYAQRGPGYKPDFPESPVDYFCLFNELRSRVNWEIESVGDFVADLFFGFISFFAIMIDLLIIMVLFVCRFFWWLLLLLGYLIGVV